MYDLMCLRHDDVKNMCLYKGNGTECRPPEKKEMPRSIVNGRIVTTCFVHLSLPYPVGDPYLSRPY